MVTSKLEQLKLARQKLATLEAAVAKSLNKELSALPEQYGFASAAEFIAAVKHACGGRQTKKASRAPSGKAGHKRKARAVVTDETRASVKKMVGDGKTGGEIAKALDLSLPTVQSIKKALGITRPRGSKSK